MVKHWIAIATGPVTFKASNAECDRQTGAMGEGGVFNPQLCTAGCVEWSFRDICIDPWSDQMCK